MQLDISFSALINAGGALLFLLTGIGILIVGRATMQGRIIGAFAVTFGLTYIFQNLYVPTDTSPVIPLLMGGSALACVVATILLARLEARGLSRTARRIWAVSGVIGLVAWGAVAWVSLALLRGVGFVTGQWGTVAFALVTGQQVAMVFLVTALGLAFRAAPTDQTGSANRNRIASLALGTGPFALFLFLSLYPRFYPAEVRSPVYTIVVTLLLVSLVGLCIPFARAHFARGERLANAVFPSMMVAGLLGILFLSVVPERAGSYFGTYGIIRTLGAVALVYGVTRHDLLGVHLPRLAVRKGVLAAGALATLFITAQIMQNFLSAEYGLFTGGIIAGAMLFAASPIQRAIERATSPSSPRPSARTGSVREDSFKAALRMALKDGKMTRSEERQLLVLADQLGIGATRAYELRDEVEREHRGGRSAPGRA